MVVATAMGTEVKRFHRCLSYFSITLKRHKDQGNLEEKAVNLKAHGFRELEPVVIMEEIMAVGRHV